MCRHTTTTFACGHEHTQHARCAPPTPRHRAHESQIVLREALDVYCVDCQLGQPQRAREEVGAWVCGEDGDDEEEEGYVEGEECGVVGLVVVDMGLGE